MPTRTDTRFTSGWSRGRGEPVKLTQGAHKNFGAAWSPDGRWLAFVSNRRDKKAQIHGSRSREGRRSA